jgi:hypothetical protein
MCIHTPQGIFFSEGGCMPQIKIANTSLMALLASVIYLSSAAASTVDNVFAIANAGSRVADGGLDADSYAYSAALLGGSITWNGTTFALGAAGAADAVTNEAITLSGSGATLNLLATAVNGAQVGQTFIVTYTDGSTASFTRSLSDWCYPQNYAGESQARKMASRIEPSGALLAGPVYLYGYSFAINSAKTVRSITLPRNRNVVVLAVGVSRSGATALEAAAPSMSPAPGTYTSAQEIKLSDSTSQAVIYYTTNGSTPTTSSALYTAGTPLPISSTTTLKAIAIASGYSASPVTAGIYTIASGAAAPPTTPLQISGTPAATAEVGQFYSFTPTVVAPSGASLTYAVTNMPAWAQFRAATGTLSGTPAAGSVGTDAGIVISVSDSTQHAALPAFSIAVEAAPPSSADTATLSWTAPTSNTNGTPLTNLGGYIVIYGTSSTALNSQISLQGANTTSVEVENLSPGTWYFKVAALNTAGVEGEFSSAVSRTIQ